MMPTYLEQLIRLVPPPDSIVDTATMRDWYAVASTIEQQIPLDPVEISVRYGSGQFLDGDFSLSIYNVFHPFYPTLVRYRRYSAEAGILADRRDGFDVEYDHPFPIGVFEYGRGQDDCSNIFWDMKGPMEHWPLWLPTPTASSQYFRMPLTEFLVKAFRGELDVDEFPRPFVDLKFVAWKGESTI